MEQLEQKGDVHKEITQNLEVIRLTAMTYKPSTIRIVTQCRNSMPKTSRGEVLTIMNCGFLFEMFVFFVGDYSKRGLF